MVNFVDYEQTNFIKLLENHVQYVIEIKNNKTNTLVN